MDIALRRAEDADAALIASWLRQPEIRRYLSASIRCNDVSESLVKVTVKRPDQSWTMIDIAGAPAGLIVMDGFDAVDRLCNLWYVLGDLSLRGRGIMPRAIKLLLAAPPLDVNVVTAWAGAINAASIRCLQKAGFREIGRISGAFNVDGCHDRVLFEKLTGEAAAAPGAL